MVKMQRAASGQHRVLEQKMNEQGIKRGEWEGIINFSLGLAKFLLAISWQLKRQSRVCNATIGRDKFIKNIMNNMTVVSNNVDNMPIKSRI